MNKVFIPQEPTRWDPIEKKLVSIMNFGEAGKFGETVICLPPGKIALTTQPTVFQLQKLMRGFCDDDFIICVGDPSLIAMTATVAAAYNRGRYKLLKYDRNSGGYISIQVDLNHH